MVTFFIVLPKLRFATYLEEYWSDSNNFWCVEKLWFFFSTPPHFCFDSIKSIFGADMPRLFPVLTLVICCTAAPIIQSCISTKSFHCCSFLRWYILGFWGDTIYWRMGVALDPNAPCVGVYFEMLMPFASCNAFCIVHNLLESAQRSKSMSQTLAFGSKVV